VSFSTTFSGLTGVINQKLSVSRFDSSLGTLESAQFTLSATMNTSAHAVNDGNFKALWDIYDYSMSLGASGNLSAIGIAAASAPVRVVGTGTPNSNGSPKQSQYQTITAASSEETYVGQGRTGNGTVVNSYDWLHIGPTLNANQSFTVTSSNDLIGAGSLDFLLTTSNYDMISISGAQTQGLPRLASFGINSDVSATVTVVYNYSTIANDESHVPEPAAPALVAVALGLATASRRAKAIPV
jgi:hypothetical protein